MKRFLILPLFLLSTIALADSKNIFTTGCELPFSRIAKRHQIDDRCTKEGAIHNRAVWRGQNDESARLQNLVKNGFCAQESVKPFELIDLAKLQKESDRIDIPHGRNHLPKIRTELKNLGEGKIVTVTGYLVDPHYSDVEKGESVNCYIPGPASNDIHISLSGAPLDVPKHGPERSRLLCSTFTAEVTPHFRPEAWEVPSLKRIEKRGLLVRITGQLFFDGSHNPCRDGRVARGDPARASLWEIHPVYNLEVCTKSDPAKCKEADWKQLK